MRRRLAAFLTVLLLLSSLSGFTAYGDGKKDERRELHITSASELIDFSTACMLDSYSEGLYVFLDSDIDLQGEAFTPVPTFSGSFDGGGHTVSNFSVAGGGSHQGFFRYLTESASVTNLRLSGNVEPGGACCRIGGLVGSNRGSVTDCVFSGNVSGMNYVGGIAGESFGLISGCSVSGSVGGKRFTGGIVGYSEGEVRTCRNNARVNTGISEGGLELESLSLSSISGVTLTGAEDTNVVSDTGGIAGFSQGILSDCVNTARIGYPHYGYNVGGIAGRQSGYTSGCTNTGEVLGRKDVGGIIGQAEPYLILKNQSSLSYELMILQTMVNYSIANFGEQTNSINSALWAIQESTESAIGSLYYSTEDLPTDFTEEYWEALRESRELMLSGISDLNLALSANGSQAAENMQQLSGQLTKVVCLISNAISAGTDMKIFNDVSDGEKDESTEGKIFSCTNTGSIDGDSNVGGIAGDMGIEYEFDLENELVKVAVNSEIITSDYNSLCIIQSCRNSGGITAKKDNCGGIVGQEQTGNIRYCENYGSVSGTDGGYIGGIVGNSLATVMKCYCVCRLDGESHVGGIAGFGTKLENCVSLIGVGAVNECCGAIAGDAATDGLSGNYYVHKTLGAVDGISYSGKAERLSYEELLKLPELPETFRKLKLIFKADGLTVKEISFEYGGSIDKSAIPEVPEKNGFTGAWPDYDYSALYFSDTINAQYTNRQSTLAAGDPTGGTQMYKALAEGSFGQDAKLYIGEYSGDAPDESHGKTLEMWVISIDGLEVDGCTVRFLPPQSQSRLGVIELYRLENGVWNALETGQSGSYLTFDIAGDKAVIAAVETENSAVTTALPAVLAVLVLGAAALIGVRLIKKKRMSAGNDR